MQLELENRVLTWQNVTTDKMKAFIGLLILLVICCLPRLKVYWTKKHSLYISSNFRLPRFEQIYHFYTTAILTKQVAAGQPGYDYLYNLRKLLDFFSPLFQSEYNTHEELSVDEAINPFKGLLSIKQYMKDKPTKWDIKVFVLADTMNGYTILFQI